MIRVRPYFGRSMGEHEGDFPVRRFVRVVRGHRGRRRADGAASVHVDKFVIDGVLQNDPVAVEVVADGLGDVVLLALGVFGRKAHSSGGWVRGIGVVEAVLVPRIGDV